MILISGLARADDAVHPVTAFARGTFVLTLEADYAHSFQLSRAKIEAGSVGLGYYVFDNFSLNVDFVGYAVEQSGPDSVIAGGDLGLRHHVLTSGPFSLYIDAAGGVCYATARTPAGGTNFNFTVQTGPGVSYRIRENVYLMGGMRYWHLSNGRREGPARNPSINALEGYVGVMIQMK
jgi:hypothetical protein